MNEEMENEHMHKVEGEDPDPYRRNVTVVVILE